MYQNFTPYINPMQMRNTMAPPAMPIHMKLARAYVPDQPFIGILSLEMALKVGTLFPNMFEAFPKIK